MATYLKSDGETTDYQIDVGEDLGTWKITPAGVRECALNNLIGSGPGVDQRYMPTTHAMKVITDMAQTAVNRGQVIDFGLWHNDFIREVAGRAGVLYTEGALGHPFRTPYIIIHSWKDEKLPFGKLLTETYPNNPDIAVSTCAYLVNPLPPHYGANPNPNDLCVDFEGTLFEGITIKGVKLLGIGDRVLVDAVATKEAGCYCAHVIPFLARFPEIFHQQFADAGLGRLGSNRDNQDFQRAAINNVCDPIMTALLLLNTRNVTYKTVTVDAKLNKARARRGKPAIPPYRKVESASYVTAVMDRIQHVKKPPTGETHASPVMHVRLGHWRHFDDGSKTHVRDALINATEESREAFKAGRSHYEFKSRVKEK